MNQDEISIKLAEKSGECIHKEWKTIEQLSGYEKCKCNECGIQVLVCPGQKPPKTCSIKLRGYHLNMLMDFAVKHKIIFSPHIGELSASIHEDLSHEMYADHKIPHDAICVLVGSYIISVLEEE